jgi:hypothetical protein
MSTPLSILGQRPTETQDAEKLCPATHFAAVHTRAVNVSMQLGSIRLALLVIFWQRAANKA